MQSLNASFSFPYILYRPNQISEKTFHCNTFFLSNDFCMFIICIHIARAKKEGKSIGRYYFSGVHWLGEKKHASKYKKNVQHQSRTIQQRHFIAANILRFLSGTYWSLHVCVFDRCTPFASKEISSPQRPRLSCCRDSVSLGLNRTRRTSLGCWRNVRINA